MHSKAARLAIDTSGARREKKLRFARLYTCPSPERLQRPTGQGQYNRSMRRSVVEEAPLCLCYELIVYNVMGPLQPDDFPKRFEHVTSII